MSGLLYPGNGFGQAITYLMDPRGCIAGLPTAPRMPTWAWVYRTYWLVHVLGMPLGHASTLQVITHYLAMCESSCDMLTTASAWRDDSFLAQ